MIDNTQPGPYELPEDKRAAWGDGPWCDEPDRVEFEAHGLPCLLRRGEVTGAWCGYAAVPPGHRLHGKGYDAAEELGVGAHGGLTYASECHGPICHVPKPGTPDDVWWFGFDCAHCWDLSPAMEVHLREVRARLPEQYKDAASRFRNETYRDVDYVRAETIELARQLKELG